MLCSKDNTALSSTTFSDNIDTDGKGIVAKAYVERVLTGEMYMENADTAAIQWNAGEKGNMRFWMRVRNRWNCEYVNSVYKGTGVVVNNYLADVGRGQKYNIHIEVAVASAEALTRLFKSCPSYPENETSASRLWLPLVGKTLKLARKQDDVFFGGRVADRNRNTNFLFANH